MDQSVAWVLIYIQYTEIKDRCSLFLAHGVMECGFFFNICFSSSREFGPEIDEKETEEGEEDHMNNVV